MAKRIKRQQGKQEKKARGEYIAVRWPRVLRQALKVAAASADPPLTMTQYLQGCFLRIQDEGGL